MKKSKKRIDDVQKETMQPVIESNLRELFKRVTKKEFIEKSDVSQISMLFKELRDLDPVKYTSAARKSSKMLANFDKHAVKGTIKRKGYKDLSNLSKKVFPQEEDLAA